MRIRGRSVTLMDRVFWVAVFLLCLWVVIESERYTRQEALTPQTVGLILVVLTGLLLVRDGLQLVRGLRGAGRSQAGESDREARQPRVLPWFLSIAIWALYVTAILWVGFYLATLVFLLVFPFLMGFPRHRWRLVLAYAVLTVAAFLGALYYGFEMLLPAGPWGL
ncbi:MAG TPA: tripartite tricarboxylate transporter TctB family protein [Dehalococcoidia bacterium]|nr:tripartite tricarboxylate transporter TctB family protein [Dehalococcoidia bacterium]